MPLATVVHLVTRFWFSLNSIDINKHTPIIYCICRTMVQENGSAANGSAANGSAANGIYFPWENIGGSIVITPHDGIKKKAVVAGGGGFIGSHLCLRLKEKGYYVIASDWKTNAFMKVGQKGVIGMMFDVIMPSHIIMTVTLCYGAAFAGGGVL